MKRLRIVPRTRGMSTDEGAAHWTVLRDSRPLTTTEQRELDQWLDSSANREAMRRAETAMRVFDGALEGDPNLRALRQAALEAGPTPSRIPGAVRTGLATAALACVVWGSGLVQWSSPAGSGGAPHVAMVASGRSPSVRRPDVHDGPVEYAAGVGERNVVRLPDGTVVTLNTRSRIAVAYTDRRRLVRLLRGQALFEVAHNRRRPFIVEAADRQVTALGTVFEVRLEPGRMNVILVRGRVVVDRVVQPGAKEDVATKPAILSPGQQFSAELGTPQKVERVDVGRRLLWREGFVEFDDVTLGAAVAEINRYTNRPILLADDGVASLRISGVYGTGQPDRFVSAVQGIVPVVASAGPPGGIILSRSRR